MSGAPLFLVGLAFLIVSYGERYVGTEPQHQRRTPPLTLRGCTFITNCGAATLASEAVTIQNSHSNDGSYSKLSGTYLEQLT